MGISEQTFDTWTRKYAGLGLSELRELRQLLDELLNWELFDTLWEVKVLVERRRQTYNRIRPHSTLGYRPPAPEAIASRCA